jgi:biopolymer transport protein ExbB/TolQ
MPPSPPPQNGPVLKFRRPKLLTTDFFIKIGSLVFAFALIWWIYSGYVWPEVDRVQMEVRLHSKEKGYVAPRSVAVIVKDPEQQAELVFWVWAIILLSLKLRRISQENEMLGNDFLRLEQGERILPEHALGHYKDLRGALDQQPALAERVLPNIILAALYRFHSTQSIGDAAGSVKERAEIAGNDLEADLSLVKYIAWAIPALGFIGTVRGIGEALSQAEKAISGDLAGVIDALGLAFNSTLVALLLSIPLMFVLHLLQGRQDKLILDLQNYCDEHVVAQMKVPAQETSTPAFQA